MLLLLGSALRLCKRNTSSVQCMTCCADGLRHWLAAGGSWRRWVLGAVVAFCALRLQMIGLVALVLWAVLPLAMHSSGFRCPKIAERAAFCCYLRVDCPYVA